MTNPPEVYRWFTSEIVFDSQADLMRCLADLQKTFPDLNIKLEPGDVGVHFNGTFDYSKMNDQFPKIIAKHSPKSGWMIKAVYIEADGYFGGWVEQLSSVGITVNSESLTHIFESGFK